MEFEWDPKKAKLDIEKHGVGFAEAEEAFLDEFAIDEFDDAHSFHEEHRFALIGRSSRRLLFVFYTIRANNVRIIAARKATRSQEKFYKDAKR